MNTRQTTSTVFLPNVRRVETLVGSFQNPDKNNGYRRRTIFRFARFGGKIVSPSCLGQGCAAARAAVAYVATACVAFMTTTSTAAAPSRFRYCVKRKILRVQNTIIIAYTRARVSMNNVVFFLLLLFFYSRVRYHYPW